MVERYGSLNKTQPINLDRLRVISNLTILLSIRKDRLQHFRLSYIKTKRSMVKTMKNLSRTLTSVVSSYVLPLYLTLKTKVVNSQIYDDKDFHLWSPKVMHFFYVKGMRSGAVVFGQNPTTVNVDFNKTHQVFRRFICLFTSLDKKKKKYLVRRGVMIFQGVLSVPDFSCRDKKEKGRSVFII